MKGARIASSPRMRSASILEPIVQGLVVGLAATQALDALSKALYRRESPWLRFHENRRRGFLHAYERAVGKMAGFVGLRFSRKQKQRWGWAFHKTFGVVGGVAYIALRQRYPRIAAGKGLAFGTGFFAIADELLVPLFGLTPGPLAFPWKVHARGAVSHIAYGVAAELTALAVDKLVSPKPPEPTERSTIVDDGILATPDAGGIPFTTASAIP